MILTNLIHQAHAQAQVIAVLLIHLHLHRHQLFPARKSRRGEKTRRRKIRRRNHPRRNQNNTNSIRKLLNTQKHCTRLQQDSTYQNWSTIKTPTNDETIIVFGLNTYNVLQ